MTLPVKLAPTAEQAASLLATVERFNAACDWLGGVAFRERCANKVALQKLAYYEVRSRFGLAAQLSIRAISKTVEAYKRDRTIQPRFRPHGAVPYDERIMSWKGVEHLSLLTLEGRAIIPVVLAAYQAGRIDRRRGQADLVHRDGTFYLYVTVDVPEPPVQDAPDYLGVDLGIINIAADSDGKTYAGGCGSGSRPSVPGRPNGCSSCAGAKRPASRAPSTTRSARHSWMRPKAPLVGSPWKTSGAFASASRLAGPSGPHCTPGRSTSCASSSPTRRHWRACRWSMSIPGTPVAPALPAGTATGATVQRKHSSGASAAASLGQPTPSRP